MSTSKSSTTTLYPVAPLDPTYRRRGYSFTVQHRPKVERVVADYDLPADQRGAITDQTDMQALNAGADVVLHGDGPVTAWDGTVLDDPLTADDKAVLVQMGLAAWRLKGMICRTPGEGRVFTVEHRALRQYLAGEHGVTEGRVAGMTWPEIVSVIRGRRQGQEGPQGAVGSMDQEKGTPGSIAGMEVHDVMREAEGHVERHGFPATKKKLYTAIGCNHRTLDKAIKLSPFLQDALASRPRSASPKKTSLFARKEDKWDIPSRPNAYDPTETPQYDELLDEPRDHTLALFRELIDSRDDIDLSGVSWEAVEGLSKEELVRVYLVYKNNSTKIENI